MDLEHSLRCTICSSTKIPCDCKYLSGLQYPPPSRKDILLQEATALLTRYRDSLLVDASKRPTSKEVNAFFGETTMTRCKHCAKFNSPRTWVLFNFFRRKTMAVPTQQSLQDIADTVNAIKFQLETFIANQTGSTPLDDTNTVAAVAALKTYVDTQFPVA